MGATVQAAVNRAFGVTGAELERLVEIGAAAMSAGATAWLLGSPRSENQERDGFDPGASDTATEGSGGEAAP